MPVVIKYVVERNGVEKMTFSSKAEADQYDKLLDTAESLEDVLNESGIIKDEQCVHQLAMYLAENKDDVLSALGNKRKKTASKATKKTASVSTTAPLLEDLVIEPDADSYFEEEDNGSDYAETDDLPLTEYDDNEVYSESDAA